MTPERPVLKSYQKWQISAVIMAPKGIYTVAAKGLILVIILDNTFKYTRSKFLFYQNILFEQSST